MNESMPDRDATDRDAPASPLGTPQITDEGLVAFAQWCRLNPVAIVMNPEVSRRVLLAYSEALPAATSSEAVSRGSTEPEPETVGQARPVAPQEPTP